MLSLIEIINHYDTVLSPFNYIIKSQNNLTLEFDIKPSEVCHLLFGTINKGLPMRQNYKGLNGYNKIKDETVTWDNLPHSVKKHSNIRTEYFDKFHKLLDKPSSGIFYNSKIVQNIHALKLKTTDIQGDFLIYKVIDNCILHLILENVSTNGTYRLTPKCFFVRKLANSNADVFLQNQKEFPILSSTKVLKP